MCHYHFRFRPFVDRVSTASLEDAIQNALKNYLPRLESTGDARVEFYSRHKRETGEYDKRFVERYNADADTTLITVCLSPFLLSTLIMTLSWFCWVIRPVYSPQ